MAWNDNLEEKTPAYNLASSDAKTIRAMAGPGSGKSFAIKRRVARLLEEGIDPKNILAITFTRTAAQDLKKEISSLGIPGADEVHSRTLHSHALKILMQADVLETTGRTPRMILDHEIAPALRDIDKEEYGGIKDKKKRLDAYLAAWATLQSDDAGFVKDKIDESFEKEFVNWLTYHKGILVGEVIPVAINYLRNNPASDAIGKYQYILVDEYQDLNKSEQEFIRLIRGEVPIVIVGDDDQSIYSFKFAHPEGIKELDKLHGPFEDITFDECRRCPIQVTEMASALISKNRNRTLGDLMPHKANKNGKIDIIQWGTYDDEIDGITQIIVKEVEAGLKPEDILVLAPRRRIGYRLRDNLIAEDIPVKSYFREAAISDEKVKRAYSLLHLISQPEDAASLRYLLGAGSADFRKSQYAKLATIANSTKTSVFETLQQILKGKIDDKGLKTILEEFRKIKTDLSDLKKAIIKDPYTAIEELFIHTEEDEIEFYEMNVLFRKAIDEIGEEELDDESFQEWMVKTFAAFQESIALPDAPENLDNVRIMSLHASKGLSAKLVILIGMIDFLMPFIPPDLDKEEKEKCIEEQRRLFYVAITRCKSSEDYEGRLIISSFLSIFGLDAARMGISANPKSTLKVSSTRFLSDFGKTSPIPVKGEDMV